MSNFDMTDNYLIWDNTDSVMVSLSRSGGAEQVAVAVAKQGRLNRNDALFADTNTDSQSRVWNIPDVLLNPEANGRILKRDDTITADSTGEVWRVNSVTKEHANSRWRAVCSRGR